MTDLANWTAPPHPAWTRLEGRYAVLEPLAMTHTEGLFEASSAPNADNLFQYLFEVPPAGRADMDDWTKRVAGQDDPMFFAVIDRATGNVGGRQALMRITPEHGVIEIGSIYWGPAIARTRVATEALYLMARHVFDDLGYRRFEWKCNADNAPSRRAAARFGFQFEGIFRQHMVTKGGNRDTAWFAMIDTDWPALRAGYEAWLEPNNFEDDGQQKCSLAAVMARS